MKETTNRDVENIPLKVSIDLHIYLSYFKLLLYFYVHTSL